MVAKRQMKIRVGRHKSKPLSRRNGPDKSSIIELLPEGNDVAWASMPAGYYIRQPPKGSDLMLVMAKLPKKRKGRRKRGK